MLSFTSLPQSFDLRECSLLLSCNMIHQTRGRKLPCRPSTRNSLPTSSMDYDYQSDSSPRVARFHRPQGQVSTTVASGLETFRIQTPGCNHLRIIPHVCNHFYGLSIGNILRMSEYALILFRSRMPTETRTNYGECFAAKSTRYISIYTINLIPHPVQ